jgi:uncharacterized protein YndB with AHSA1/START domain
MTVYVRVAIVLLALALLAPSYGQSGGTDAPGDASPADWPLSRAQLARLGDGAVLVVPEVANDPSAGDVRAAVQIAATPERVFRTLTDCSQALLFVPHLERCMVLESGPDRSFEIVEHQIRYSWLMPRADIVFRADYDRFKRIRVSNVRGDFRENRAVWEFRPIQGGAGTIVTYRVHLVPAFYVPRWMWRATLKRDLPELMKGLRARAEAPDTGPTTPPPAAASPGKLQGS